MKKVIPLLLILCVITAMPAFAARITSTMVTHTNQVYQVGNAYSDILGFHGYFEPSTDVITAAPGILAIDPGICNWRNFVRAYSDGVPYVVKNTTLVKETPYIIACQDVFPAQRITQQGTSNIRLWWPLVYEVPGTTLTLSILYNTPTLYDDDNSGPNPPGWTHVEQWTWVVSTDLDHLSLLLDLFHELPYGKCEVPLISDEALYTDLKAKIARAIAFLEAGDTASTAAEIADFELEVMDACICTQPAFPNPTGCGTGITNTTENPACCKLLADAEYILDTGIGYATK